MVILSPSYFDLAWQITNEGTVQSSSGKVTPTPSRSVTQQILYTSTLPNGGVTTVTSLTVVPADQAQTAGTSTNTANASVQSNSAESVNAFSINGVLGALSLVVVFSGL